MIILIMSFFICPSCGSEMVVEEVEIIEMSKKVWLKLCCMKCYTAKCKFYIGQTLVRNLKVRKVEPKELNMSWFALHVETE